MTMTAAAPNVNIRYDSASLLALRPPVNYPPPNKYINCLKQLENLQTTNSEYGLKKYTSKRNHRRRGRRGGVRARLRRRGIRTPLPSIIFGNVRSIRNKMDEFSANCKFIHEYRDSAIIAIMETWLQEKDLDCTVDLDGYTLIRSDRRGVNKERGGGVAAYINNRWCTQATVKDSLCDKDIECLVISCRPFYLPREFNKVTLFVVYIPPDADADAAAEILENLVTKYENECPEGVQIILGDFNHCNFKEKVPTYEQTVNCNTRGDAILDKMYCNVKSSYRVLKRPCLGNGDHNMLFCIPIYKQVLKREKCKQIEVRKWDEENTMKMQACFECTDWSLLIENGADVNTNLDIFNSYFHFCFDMLVPSKRIKVFPNNKPWINKDLKLMLNEKRRLAQNGNRTQQKTIQKQVNKKITESKKIYKEKIEGLFSTNRVKDAWKGLKTLCGYNKEMNTLEPDNSETFANDLNCFFARFENSDFSEERNNVMRAIESRRDERLIITHDQVVKSLKRVRAGKATGPDGVPAKALKYCANQLAPVLHTLFQASIDQGVVPAYWKMTEIKPIPKVSFPKEYNNFRPVALTSNIVKCLEDILTTYLCENTNNVIDPYQFAYQANRSVQDASLTLLNDISKHVDKQNTQIRLLFIDFSSAFNTMQIHILLHKLMTMNVNCCLLKWICSFLTHRQQYTKINDMKSDIIITNTGSPQGCVISPVLFILYTDDCRSLFSDCSIIKYADDTVITGKIFNDDCENFYAQVDFFVDWCKSNFLELNVKKTKEMIIDFRTKNQVTPDNIIINEETVERVDNFKYLGYVIDNQLKGKENTDLVFKKCNQRLHFMRLLNNLHIDRKIISLFYKSIIESVINFSLTTWYEKLRNKDKNRLNRIVKKSRKLGADTEPLENLYQEGVLKQANKIMQDDTHPLHSCYKFLRSGRRLALPQQRTNRYKKSFVPMSILLFNNANL